MNKFMLMFALLVARFGTSICFAENLELNRDELMMRSTFMVTGGGVSGTVFLMVTPLKAFDPTSPTTPGKLTLITADHVFSKMPTDTATIYLREKVGDVYRKLTNTFPIRANGTNLWIHHPTADVAAMRFSMPTNVDANLALTTVLADSKLVEAYKIHPGDELRVLGYPHGVSANDAGFPILRSGRIASFPLTPFPSTPSFLLDFQVFDGNSGGPVYILERRYMKEFSPESVTIFMVMGLISEQSFSVGHFKEFDDESFRTERLGLGVVIPAQAITETIALLPP